MLSGDIGEGNSRADECKRIILAQIRCSPCQPDCLGVFPLTVHDPSGRFAPQVHSRSHAISCRKSRIPFDGSIEVGQRRLNTVFCLSMEARQPSQEMVIGIKVISWFSLGPIDLRLFQFGKNCSHYACCDLILKIEDVLKRPVKPIRPQMCCRRSIDKLSCYPYFGACLAHTAFKNVAHTKLTPDLLHIHGPALVSEARIAGDHE